MSEWVYHAKRFWVQQPQGKQHRGWNTDFEPCIIAKKTAKRIMILSSSLGILWLNREQLESEGKVYHSRPHEYFYKLLPPIDPERPSVIRRDVPSVIQKAFSALGLTYPSSQIAITKAYKRKAKQVHPDTGGHHDAFIELHTAFETALEYI